MGDIITSVAKPLEAILGGLTGIIHNYGISIIIFTLLVRLVIMPLNIAQLRSARAMQALSPLIKDLQKKHGQDRETLTKATMQLYKDYKVNPAAGCLPLLVQMPVLWGMFNALRTFADNKVNPIYHSSFLWLPNLGHPDPWHILPLAAGAFQWVQQRMMMQKTVDPQQQQMNQIMQFMPLMIVFFAWAYPSGLAVYWVTSTIFSIVLQYLITGWGQLPILNRNGPFSTPGAGLLGGRLNPTTPVVSQMIEATPVKANPSKAKPNTPRPPNRAPRVTTIQPSDNVIEGVATVESGIISDPVKVRRVAGGRRMPAPRNGRTANGSQQPAKGVKK